MQTRFNTANTESTVTKAQGMQKVHHDTKAKETRYMIGPKWLPGVIVEQLGTLTFLVQLDNGMFWKRHVDQLCGRDQSSSSNTDSEAAYTSTDSNDKNTNESSEISNGAVTDTTSETTQNETVTTATSNFIPARRYSDRARRPPKWYQTDSDN